MRTAGRVVMKPACLPSAEPFFATSRSLECDSAGFTTGNRHTFVEGRDIYVAAG
jgi:hypothetical protein